MVNSIVASLALFGASASALSAGSAHVINMCTYDVYLCNVPAADGGFSESDKTLASGESWEHPWTELTNGNGWSIKLSKSTDMSNILQYEYTFHNDGIIWYDLSCVNGNPWDKNWEITAAGSNCSPKQQAYRYATDDAYGMQSCSQDASITVTLCSGEATANGTYGNSGSASSAPAYSSPSYTTASVAAVTYGYNWNNADVSSSLAPVVTPSTFATQVTAAPESGNGAEMTEVETVVVVETVTAYAAKPRAKRHEHHVHRHYAA